MNRDTRLARKRRSPLCSNTPVPGRNHLPWRRIRRNRHSGRHPLDCIRRDTTPWSGQTDSVERPAALPLLRHTCDRLRGEATTGDRSNGKSRPYSRKNDCIRQSRDCIRPHRRTSGHPRSAHNPTNTRTCGCQSC